MGAFRLLFFSEIGHFNVLYRRLCAWFKHHSASFFLLNVFTLVFNLIIEMFPQRLTSRQCYSFFDPLVCSVYYPKEQQGVS